MVNNAEAGRLRCTNNCRKKLISIDLSTLLTLVALNIILLAFVLASNYVWLNV